MKLPMPTTKREQMGEVRVRVLLSNGTDVELAKKGLIEPDKIRRREVDAFVDTGTTKSVISAEIADQLGLTILYHTFGKLADGSRVPAGLSSAILFEMDGRSTLEGAYVLGDEVLIGQTVLESMDLLVDCTNRRVIPNPAHPEGPVLRL
jgi:predicted aspartyl protease